ncbi:hypothetical protein B0H17DRAFT_1124816 [Mycena rosella]|uniref:Uncharacterized protein n=1 Tax=Mycena rosella TaxID=1033263 RepID=A0AAD7H087_MYCRO|nr:hypothetical protein B0H17DRAFT_1124816 [Mycena rosella]
MGMVNLTLSSAQSMVQQTEHSFDARSNGTAPAPISHTCSGIFVYAGAAPSNNDFCTQVSIRTPPSSTERVNNARARTEANITMLATRVLQNQQAIEALSADEASYFQDVLRRIKDIKKGKGVQAGDGTTDLDLTVLENRNTIEKLTEAVNELSDLHDKLEIFRREARREIQALQNLVKPRPAGNGV